MAKQSYHEELSYDPRLMRLVEKAEALMRELDAYNEFSDDLIDWYIDKLHQLGTYDALDADLKQWCQEREADRAEQRKSGIFIS